MVNVNIPPSGIVIAGACDLVLLRLKNSGQARVQIGDKINNMYDVSLFGEKFRRIVLIFLHGERTHLVPHYDRMTRDRDLGLSVELDATIMAWADKYNLELMKEIYMIATCESVLHALRKHKLPTALLETERAKYGTIPETIEECERLYGKED